MTKTAVIRLLADAGPNTFNTFGVGADQVSRLQDADDASGIQAAATGLRSQFSIDPADIPADLDYVTQVTFVMREAFSFTAQQNGCVYEVYVSAALFQSRLELTSAAPIDDTRHDILDGVQTIPLHSLATMEVALLSGGWTPGDRWQAMEWALEVAYVTNAANVELHTQTGDALLQTASGAAELHAQDGVVKLVAK